MFKQFLCAVALFAAGLTTAAEQTIRSGEIYATVEMLPDGELNVIDVHSDLPPELNPEIETWLQKQAIQFAVVPAADPPNRTTVQIDYSIIEDEHGGQGLLMMVKGTGVSAPEQVAAPVDLVEAEIPVAVTLRNDGTVARVEPLTDLPEGMQAGDLEAAVREDIESDPDIQQAAREGRLAAEEYTITVQVQTADN